MRTRTVLSFGCWATFAFGTFAGAQTTSSIDTDANGIQWRTTKSVVQRSVPTTEYQTREQKVYHPQVTTDYQTYQQMYVTPVTEYRWVSRMRGLWNPFGQPYWTHNLEPFTRWETRPGTVQIPTARTDWVEETRQQQVAITTYRPLPVETVVREPVSVPPATSLGTGGATAIATRPMSQRLESDPPRYGNTALQR
jgi:hypothetical protein